MLPKDLKFVPESDTSFDAAVEIAPDITSLQARVYLALLKRPSTDEELQELLNMNPSTERPRRVELVERGLVRDSGERRLTRAHRSAVVWEVTGRVQAPPRQLNLLDRLKAFQGRKQ